MAADNAYRARAWECLSLAEWMNDPEERAEMVRFARMWMSLAEPIDEGAEPIDEGRGSYEFPRGRGTYGPSKRRGPISYSEKLRLFAPAGDEDYDVIGPDGIVIGRLFGGDHIAYWNTLDVDTDLRGLRGPDADTWIGGNTAGRYAGIC